MPVGKHGDVYDRYIVRMAEMRESCKIIEQCLDKIHGGDTQNSLDKQAEVAAAKAAALRHPSWECFQQRELALGM